MSGERLSVRLPRRIVPIWLSAPWLAYSGRWLLRQRLRCHGSHAWHEDAEFAVGGFDKPGWSIVTPWVKIAQQKKRTECIWKINYCYKDYSLFL